MFDLGTLDQAVSIYERQKAARREAEKQNQASMNQMQMRMMQRW